LGEKNICSGSGLCFEWVSNNSKLDRYDEFHKDKRFICVHNCRLSPCNGCKLMFPAHSLDTNIGNQLCGRCHLAIWTHSVLPRLGIKNSLGETYEEYQGEKGEARARKRIEYYDKLVEHR
jgi:hypothetical protein